MKFQTLLLFVVISTCAAQFSEFSNVVKTAKDACDGVACQAFTDEIWDGYCCIKDSGALGCCQKIKPWIYAACGCVGVAVLLCCVMCCYGCCCGGCCCCQPRSRTSMAVHLAPQLHHVAPSLIVPPSNTPYERMPSDAYSLNSVAASGKI